MARYIDADKLLKNVKDATPMNWTNSEAEIQAQLDWKCCIALIKNQPTADVAEVKHGFWKKSQFSGRSGFYSVRDVICSECGIYSTFLQHEIRPDYYCPNCGAKMDGGKEE